MIENKICQNCKQSFIIEPEDFDFYKRMEVPPPTFCWLCRAQRRLAFRNERALYKRTSSFSGTDLFSTYPADAHFPVYTQEEWWSDEWDPMTYGEDYDFSRPFFEQYLELSKKVPRPAKSIITVTNSEYSNNASFLKNCYLLFNASYTEDCAYGNGVDYSRDCIDNSHIQKSEQCYENFWLTNCNRTLFSSQCVDCIDVYFSKNLRGCTNCFGCVNLRGKSYCIFNEQYSKEEYEEKLKSFNLGSHTELEQIRRKAQDFWLKFPTKYLEGTKNADVGGSYISNSRNVKKSYLVNDCENLKYCQYMQVPSSKECYDYSVWGENATFSYEIAMTGAGANNLKFCLQCYTNVNDLEYSEYCMTSSNLFGCIGLRNKQYCILNKQYAKEEYEALISKIKKQMDEVPFTDQAGRVYRYGEFFPVELSTYAYNESLAYEHFPLTEEQSKKACFQWKNSEKKQHTVTLPYTQIPDQIKDVEETVLQQVIGCVHEGSCSHGCTGAFRVIPQELQFYKKFNLALPRLCVNCRHYTRIAQRNSIKVYERQCQCAGVSSDGGVYRNSATHSHGLVPCPHYFETGYALDRSEIIYCEECYQVEVV